MTYREIQDRVLRACGHPTSASSTPRDRIKQHINTWHRRLLTRPGLLRLLRDSSITFDSVADQAVYGLGLPMGRLLGLTQIANEVTLTPRSLDWLRRADPGLTAEGDPSHVYIVRGWFPVQQHPSDASEIWIKSDSASDTQDVYWEVVLESLERVSGTTTLTGVTAVQLGTFSTAIEVVRLTLESAAVGTVTVHEDSGTGTTLASIRAGRTANRYLHVQLWPTPSAALTYRVDYTREIEDLVEDTEEPLLPPDFHHLLALGAEYEEWRKLSDDRAVMVRQDLEMELRHLSDWLWNLPDFTQGGPVRYSRLGGWFPAGT
jgi:hypothetical protein